MSIETDNMLHSEALPRRANDIGSILERQAKEDIASRKQSITWNAQENTVFLVKGKIALKAVEDKIIILLDKFKTGYECSVCAGTGELDKCPKCGGKGTNRFDDKCTECNGAPWNAITCPMCQGRGSTIVVPESVKALPTSGIIVSVGPDCKTRKIGDRVLFGAHTGYMLPFKGNVKLRIMRAHEPLCDIFMLEEQEDDSVLNDFIQFPEEYR